MEKFLTQIKLILVIFGDFLTPDEITNLTKINPTNSWVKGDLIPHHKGLIRKDNKILTRKESAWEYSTGFVQTLDFENVSNQFETMFRDKNLLLKKYINENGLDVTLNIVVEIADEEKPSIHFNKKIIELCNDINAEIDIDMYLLNNN